MSQTKPEQIIEQLADYLLQHQQEITDKWLELIKYDDKIESSKKLTTSQLIDSLPKFFEQLCQCLHHYCNPQLQQQAQQTARKHGQQRQHHGYQLTELMREIGLLRNILLSQYVTDFMRQKADCDIKLEQQARWLIEEFVNTSIFSAVEQFVTETEREAAEYQSHITQAQEKLLLTHQQLLESEQQFQMLVRSVKEYAIFIIDPDGRMASWNEGVQRIKGYDKDEFIGLHFSQLFLEEDRRINIPESELHIAREHGQFIGEGPRLRKDGTVFEAEVALTSLRDQLGVLRGYIKVTRDITERKKQEQAVNELLHSEQQARQEAETASRIKDEFLAMVSHELKTPLQAIIGWIKLLIDGRLDQVGAQRAIQTIARNAKSQSRLIDDLLDISRIITGKLRLEIQQLELISLVQSVLESVKPAADAKQIELKFNNNCPDCFIMGDASRLQQVCWNILSNAIKFTPFGGVIEISTSMSDAEVELRIKDNGQGISQDYLPFVFDRFSQSNTSTSRQHGGLGIGLAITRHLVEAHGGRIAAESAGEHQGATFIVRLPIGTPFKDHSSNKPQEKCDSSPAHCPPQVDGLKVLLIEDDADSRELLALIMQQCQVEVTAVANADEALTALSTIRPELIISDIGLPGADGYELLAKIRSDYANGGDKIPIIALTAFARNEDRRHALDAGFNMYLAKPIDPSELLDNIARLTGRDKR